MTIDRTMRSVAPLAKSTVDVVTAEIRRGILTGALPAGQQFSIRELAHQLGVSHIPIREALRRLESQGLILLRHAKSAEVAELTIDDLEAIYKLRLRIEPQLAAESLPSQTAERIKHLGALLEAMRDIDPDEAWQAHHDFHAALIEPAATPWDDRVLATLWTAAERYTHLVFDYTQISSEESERRHERHDALLEAVLTGNAAKLQLALVDHLLFNEDECRRQILSMNSGSAIRAER